MSHTKKILLRTPCSRAIVNEKLLKCNYTFNLIGSYLRYIEDRGVDDVTIEKCFLFATFHVALQNTPNEIFVACTMSQS